MTGANHIADVDRAIGSATRDLEALGGVLVCLSCDDVMALPEAETLRGYLANGWPECCGETRHWVTRSQMRGESSSPMPERARAALERAGLA